MGDRIQVLRLVFNHLKVEKRSYRCVSRETVLANTMRLPPMIRRLTFGTPFDLRISSCNSLSFEFIALILDASLLKEMIYFQHV